MNLRQFCSQFDQNTLMDVLIGTLSTGAYSIKEILYDGKFNSNLLDSPIKEGSMISFSITQKRKILRKYR